MDRRMTQTETLRLALEAMKVSNNAWKSLADSGDAGFWKAEEQGYYQLNEQAITVIEAALEAKDEPWECVCGANLYIDANGIPRSKASVEPATVMFKPELEAKDEPVATIDSLEQEIYENTRQFVSLDVMEWMLKRYYTTPPQQEAKDEPMKKLQVTLEDRPVDIELAQYKRMFEDACANLGAINQALGLDFNDGGAESILFAIEELRGRSQEPVAWMVYTLDGKSVCVTDNPTNFTPEHRALPLYTTPPQRTWVGLTEDEIKPCWYEACQTDLELTSQLVVYFARAIEAKLKEKNNA